MEAVKQAMGVIGAVVGVLTALVTLYAKFFDIKKKVARDRRLAAATALAAAPPVPPEAIVPPPADLAIPVSEANATARAQALVKAPALALIVVGGISLVFNLLSAGYGLVDQFVTPLSAESRQKREAAAASVGAYPDARAATTGAADRPADDASAMIGAFALLSFAVASGAAMWAGYGMLHLRSYWLSVAGSFAIMPGACVCCLAGFPVGAWSLSVLLKPEVVSAFR